MLGSLCHLDIESWPPRRPDFEPVMPRWLFCIGMPSSVRSHLQARAKLMMSAMHGNDARLVLLAAELKFEV